MFNRKNSDLHVDVEIPYHLACLGGETQVPTLDGDVKVRVPAGTQPGDRSALRNKGVPKLHSKSRGHQYLHYRVTIPKYVTVSKGGCESRRVFVFVLANANTLNRKLSDKEKELLEQLAELGEGRTKSE